MTSFRQTIVLSLALVVIMVCGAATQTTNAISTKAIQPTTAAAATTTRQTTTTPPITTVPSVQTGSASTTGFTANLTYECYSNETIRLVGSAFIASYEGLQITSSSLRSNANCTATKERDGGFLIEGKDCFNNLLRGSLTPKNNPDIVGGKSFIEFTFECDGLPKNGTIKTVTLKVSSNLSRYRIRGCGQQQGHASKNGTKLLLEQIYDLFSSNCVTIAT